MKIKTKARVLLGIFMLSGMIGQVSTFYASGNGEEKLPSDESSVSSIVLGRRGRCVGHLNGNFYESPSYSLSDKDRANGNTMLHVAASKGDVNTFYYYEVVLFGDGIQRLSKALYVKNRNGDTPLHVAILHGQFEVVRYILNFMCRHNINPSDQVPQISSDLSDRTQYPYGIDFNFEHFLQIRNNDGMTPIDLARSQLNYNVVRVTELAGAVKHTDIVENVCGMSRYNRMIDLFNLCLKVSKIIGRYSDVRAGVAVTEKDENELVNSITKDTVDLFVGDTILMDWAEQHGCEKLRARLSASDVYGIFRRRLWDIATLNVLGGAAWM